ncbi:sialidase family protein, partial [Brachyspira hampsonii]
STDDGITWSDWKLAEGNVNGFGQGLLSGYDRGFAASGTGARLANGTLMGAMLIRKGVNNNTRAAAVIVSTDNGNTWTVRSIVKRKSGAQDEPKVITQLNDRRILLSVRSGQRGNRRVWFRSKADLGADWEEFTPTGNFYDANCNAEGILFTSTLEGYDKNRLIHLALDSNTDRRNLTAFISYDEGASWEKQRVLNSGRAGYAALARLNDGTIVTLSEEQGGQSNLPQNSGNDLYNIVFRRFNLRWLTNQKDFYTPPDKTAIRIF